MRPRDGRARNAGRAWLAVFLAWLPGYATAQSGVQPASFEIPYLAPAPIIDGTIDETEWRQAAALTGGVAPLSGGHRIAKRNFVIWLGWDEDALYLAVRSRQRPGEPYNFGGDSLHDTVEIGVLPYQSQDLRHPYRLFLSDSGVTSCDIIDFRMRVEQPPIITRFARPDGWTAGITSASRVIPDPDATFGEGTRIWELETRIPRSVLAIDQPNAPDDGWRFVLARNYSEPREQVHLPVAHGFFTPRGYVQARLTRQQPSVQFLNVSGLLNGRDNVALRFHNPTAEPVAFNTTIGVREPRRNTVLYETAETVTVPAGASVDRQTDQPISGLKAGTPARIDLTVKSAGPRPVLTYQADFVVDTPAP